MKHIFNIFIILIINTLPTFGVSLNDIDNNPISKYCRKIAGSGGGNINCSKNTNSEEHILQCSYGLKPNANPEEIKVELAAYCSKTLEQQSKKLQAKNNHSDDNFDFAAASATQNAQSGLLLPTPTKEAEPQPNAPSKQEMSQSNIERDNCVRNQDKKHTKYENGKCVCENNDYEMQDDGVCTLKRAKCKEKSHTKYENGRCVCESDKYEMHSDNNCYMTRAALDAEASEMEDADNAAKDEQLFLETRKEACAIDNLGEWNDKTHKCKCKSGYKLGDDYACHATNKTATNEENKTLCEKDGAGKWNKTLNKCNCNEKNHIFDEEIGCTAATPKFIEAQKEIENLKSQLEATITALNK